MTRVLRGEDVYYYYYYRSGCVECARVVIEKLVNRLLYNRRKTVHEGHIYENVYVAHTQLAFNIKQQARQFLVFFFFTKADATYLSFEYVTLYYSDLFISTNIETDTRTTIINNPKRRRIRPTESV